MARRAVLPQSDLTRYARALRAAGVDQWRIIVDPLTGKHEIIVIAGGAEASDGDNPCDRLLQT